MRALSTIVLLSAVFSGSVYSESESQAESQVESMGKEPSSRCNDYNPLRTAFFGDTHVHTKYSLDASTQDTRTTPAQAYEFAKGQSIGLQPWSEDGRPARTLQLDRPLDFTALTDHAELFGEVTICNTPEMEGYGSWQCKLYRVWPQAAFFYFNVTAMRNAQRLGFCGDDGELCLQAAQGPWQDIQQAAADANDECNFTSFVAYEWTGVASNVGNLHRNVIFANEVVPELPTSFIDGSSEGELWDALDEQCIKSDTGCDAIAIPHNSNLSDGQMFTNLRKDDTLISAEDAEQRARIETLVEVMQHKGDSECYFGPGSTEDELCNFERLPYSTFHGKFMPFSAELADSKDGFLREVMRDGFREQKRIGTNPFKWGFIGSTDTHLGTPGAVSEADFPGHGGAGGGGVGLPDDLEFGPGGLAVFYAEENTREALFAAMKRREAYGTSGPRIGLRFFGGWEFEEGMCGQPGLVEQGYSQGVPMGSDLPAATSEAPKFVVQAMQDAGSKQYPGTPLQRVQIIKGWVDENGESQEAIYEIAGNPNNGASVDLSTCQTSGAGYSNLCAVWQDPDFDPKQSTFYYSRAVENPVCRWSQQFCLANDVNCDDPDRVPEGLEACCSVEHQPVIQERAWSSPIWYDSKK